MKNISNEEKKIDKPQNANDIKKCVVRSCVHCGNDKHFENWTELEYNDGSDEPTTGNHLIEVELSKCLQCGEVL